MSKEELKYSELDTLNRATVIFASSLEVDTVFERFIDEIRKELDIDWAALVLNEGTEISVLGFTSKIDSKWKAGERIATNGTAAEWVFNNKKPLIDSDTVERRHSYIAEPFILKDIRSVACLPLMVGEKVTGCITFASCKPGTFSSRDALLDRIAAQISLLIENIRLFAEMKLQARIDGLTGLYNRRFLDDTLASEIHRLARYGGVFSLIVFDLDALKKIDDKFGHVAGDRLLRTIGEVVKNSIRNSDIPFRYGGDEFAIVLPNTMGDTASSVAERVRKSISDIRQDGSISITASFGVATWPANGSGANDLITAADFALYRAKNHGGNRCEVA